MERRWLALAFGLLFAGLTVAFVLEGKHVQTVVALVQAAAMFSLFWWETTRDERAGTGGERTR